MVLGAWKTWNKNNSAGVPDREPTLESRKQTLLPGIGTEPILFCARKEGQPDLLPLGD